MNSKDEVAGRILKKGAESFGIQLTDQQVGQFFEYYRLLVQWNEFMNLTAITEMEEVMEKHFVDSLALSKAAEVGKIETLIDVGTGAGFPGIPLKIAYPHLHVVLLDSLNKRVKFLNAVIEALGLTRIQAVHGRAEDAARQKDYREQFDAAVSRAVANMAALSEYCLPFIKIGGVFVPYKSGNIEEELKDAGKAVKTLGGTIRRVEKFQLPDTDIERSLVLIEKTERTDKRYPRKAGLPSKEPIR